MHTVYKLIRILALLVVGTACSQAPARGADPAGKVIEARSLDLSYSTGIRRRANQLVNDGSQWEAVWKELWDERQEIGGAPPEIDFSSQSVIVAALGGRSSGGYRVTIEVERSTPAELNVLVTEHKPDSTCIVTAAVTYPTSIVTVPVTAKTATFRTRTITEPCG